MYDELMTTAEVAALLRIREDSVRRLARAGRIPALLVGGHTWRFPRDQVAEYVRGTWQPEQGKAE